MLNYSNQITGSILIEWLYSNTPKIRHKTYMTGMGACMNLWLNTETKKTLEIQIEEYFIELKKMADDSECEFQALAARSLDTYKTKIMTTIQNLRLAIEGWDVNYMTALTQAVLKDAPTEKKTFETWLTENAKAIYHKNFYWWSFVEEFQPLSSMQINALYLLKKNCTLISEDIVSKNYKPDLENIKQLTANLSLAPLKQVQAAFQSLPAETLQLLMSNILKHAHIDKTKLKFLIQDCLATHNISSKFITARHINALFALKEQLRDVSAIPSQSIEAICAKNIGATTAKVASFSSLLRYVPKLLGFNTTEWLQQSPITGQTTSKFFAAYGIFIAPILMIISNKLPNHAGNLLKNLQTVISIMNPILWAKQLTRLIIGNSASNFFMFHNIAQQLTPDAIPNFFSAILPTWISRNLGFINETINSINPLAWASEATSEMIEPAVEFILDDDNILPLIAVTSAIAVVAYRSPELKYLYHKLKDSIIEFTGETHANWDEVEAAFAMPEREAVLLLSNGLDLAPKNENALSNHDEVREICRLGNASC